MSFFALSWIAASHGPGAASLVLACGSIPLVGLILVGGAMADRYGARTLMICCDAAMVLVMVGLAAAAAVGLPVWGLAVVAVLAGTAAALRRPAAGVFPRLFFRGDDLSRAMASATLVQQLMRTAGPSLGGLLLAAGGIALTAGVDAVTFLIIVVVLIRVRPPLEPPRAQRPSQSLRRQIADGVRTTRAMPGAIASIVAITCLASTILPLVSLCLPLLGHGRGWSAGQTGLAAGAWVLGSMAVMAVVSRRGKPSSRAALAGPLLAALGAVTLAVTSTPYAAIPSLAAIGAGAAMLTARIVPLLIDATPADKLSRVHSLLGLAQTAPALASTVALGMLSAAIPPDRLLLGLALILLAAGIPVWRADQGLEPQRDLAALSVGVEVSAPTSGTTASAFPRAGGTRCPIRPGGRCWGCQTRAWNHGWMVELTQDEALRAGGWDPRYAVVRAIVSRDGIAAVLIDPNGDGGSIDLDEYRRGPDGGWVAGNSGGGAGDSGTSWSPYLVATYGRAEPGERVDVDYCGRAHSVTASDDGWWLFATPSLDDHSMPKSRSGR